MKLRGKCFLIDEEWCPVSGIRVLKEGTEFSPLGLGLS